MKKYLVIGLIISIILISGCAQKQNLCTEREESCCKGDTCSKAEALCVEGSIPVFKGCDNTCNPIVSCE